MSDFRPSSHFAVIALLAISLMGCSKAPTPPQVEEPPPRADSPQAALRLLEWCWNGRDTTLYRTLLTDDFVFAFAPLDPYGIAYRDKPWTRTDDLISTRNLFHGSADKPAAREVRLVLDQHLGVVPDPRPGKEARWHRYVRSNLMFSLLDGEGNRWNVSGSLDFFLVRGDSAHVGQGLLYSQQPPDTTRWFLERWGENSTIGGTHALPSKQVTLGSVKVLYR